MQQQFFLKKEKLQNMPNPPLEKYRQFCFQRQIVKVAVPAVMTA